MFGKLIRSVMATNSRTQGAKLRVDKSNEQCRDIFTMIPPFQLDRTSYTL